MPALQLRPAATAPERCTRQSRRSNLPQKATMWALVHRPQLEKLLANVRVKQDEGKFLPRAHVAIS